MGNDEHGPAYPEAYSCPVCGVRDADAYLRCYDGGCPDGRDQARFKRLAEIYDPYAEKNEWEKRQPQTMNTVRSLVGWACFLALLLWLMWPIKAPAMDHGFNPNDKVVRWMESLQRPNMPGSCCGKGDGYPVEDYYNNHDGTWTAVIGDGSAMVYPDGTTRQYIDTGHKVIVPDELVNKEEDDLDNPTDVSWIFMTVGDSEPRTVYCLIRHPSGN